MQTTNDAVLVTGAAGFIGFHVAKRLLDAGRNVVGVDSLTHYYDVELKRRRLAELGKLGIFLFEKIDLADRARTAELFKSFRFPYVIHLAAQTGVRHSLVDPHAYVDANLQGSSTCWRVVATTAVGTCFTRRRRRSTVPTL